MTETVSYLGSPTQRTAAALLSRSFAYDADVLPISYDGASLTVAVATESVELVDRVRQLTRKEIRTVVLPVREIREALKALYPAVTVRDADSQAAQTLDEIFSAAISNYASDVHIEPTDARAGRVRLDVDGLLQRERSLEGGLFERVVSLVKVDRQLAQTLVERLSSALRDRGLRCSLGAALMPDDATDAASLLAAADRALYKTKASGKNGFSFA